MTGRRNRSSSFFSPRWGTTSMHVIVGALVNRAAAGSRDLVAVHWRHPVDDYPLSGDEVHRNLAESCSAAGMTHLVEHVEDDFRLDVWSHDARSVALRTGVPHQDPIQKSTERSAGSELSSPLTTRKWSWLAA